MTRIRSVIATSLAIVALTGCLTPEEFAEFERRTGIELSADQEAAITEARAAAVLTEQKCADATTRVDALAAQHDYQDLETAWTVISTVAIECRGWSPEVLAAWAPGLQAVVLRESAACFNLRRGASFANHDGAGCQIGRQGRGSDSGYFQVLMGVHKSWLCPQEGLCSPADVVASPAASATAGLALVERAGRQGWCYTSKLRRGAACRAMAGLPLPVRSVG